jgi:hypothetical protein
MTELSIESGLYLPELGPNIVGQPWYARRTHGMPQIMGNKGESTSLAEHDAIQEIDLFLDAVRQTYTDHGYHERAESAHRFQENIYVLDSEKFNESTLYLAEELATAVIDSPRTTVIHASSDDLIDQRVGSSEYVVDSVFGHIRRDYPGLINEVEYKGTEDIVTREPVKGERIFFYDDWTITGMQATRILEPLNAVPVEARFIALRQNWRDNVLSWPENVHVEYWHGAPPIRNIAEGPSIIGPHSAVNIGWQNRLATFGVDRAWLKGDTPLPLLGDVIRPYRTRIGYPGYYRKPNDTIWQSINNGGDGKSVAEFSVEALTKKFRKR